MSEHKQEVIRGTTPWGEMIFPKLREIDRYKNNPSSVGYHTVSLRFDHDAPGVAELKEKLSGLLAKEAAIAKTDKLRDFPWTVDPENKTREGVKVPNPGKIDFHFKTLAEKRKGDGFEKLPVRIWDLTPKADGGPIEVKVDVDPGYGSIGRVAYDAILTTTEEGGELGVSLRISHVHLKKLVERGGTIASYGMNEFDDDPEGYRADVPF